MQWMIFIHYMNDRWGLPVPPPAGCAPANGVDRGPHRWGARLLVCLDDVLRRLPEPFHADPADRFLVVQARELGIPLLSADNS
jgi:hypothetical protein